jgi:hypothetical protein
VALRAVTGFEFGTIAGLVTGLAGAKLFDVSTGSVAIVTTTPRTGTYCLELAPAASIANLQWTTDTLGTSQTFGRVVFAFRFVGSLPSGGTKIALFSANFNAELSYNVATGKLAAGWETESAVDGPTIAADTWYVIEMQARFTATKTIDWSVDGVAQTSVTSAGADGTISAFYLGTYESETFTARYDDVVIYTDTSTIAALGPHRVRLLQVDTADSVTLSGTVANFNTFTANGTMAAWDATVARDNIDELPPTISASADGFAQITSAINDYVQVPLTSYTLTGTETVTGARMVVPGWAASAAANAVSFRSWNGTTETTLFATADPGFDNSTTAPAWMCKMLTLADIDTQAELNALAIRVGFSSSAGVDVGVHAVYVELAVKGEPGDAPTGPSALILPPHMLFRLIGAAALRYAPEVGGAMDSRAQTGVCSMGLAGTSAQTKRAPAIGVSSVGLAGAAAVVKRATPAGAAALGLAGISAQVKRATPAGRAALGLAASSTAVKRAPQASTASLGLAARAVAVHIAPRAGAASVGLCGAGVARKIAPQSSVAPLGLAGYGPTQQGRPQTGRAAMGLVGYVTAVHVGAPAGRSALGIAAYGSQAKRATPVATGALGLSGRGVQFKRATPIGVGSVGLAGRGSSVKRATPVGLGSLGLAARATAVHLASRTGIASLGLAAYGTARKVAALVGRAVLGLSGHATLTPVVTNPITISMDGGVAGTTIDGAPTTPAIDQQSSSTTVIDGQPAGPTLDGTTRITGSMS